MCLLNLSFVFWSIAFLKITSKYYAFRNLIKLLFEFTRGIKWWIRLSSRGPPSSIYWMALWPISCTYLLPDWQTSFGNASLSKYFTPFPPPMFYYWGGNPICSSGLYNSANSSGNSFLIHKMIRQVSLITVVFVSLSCKVSSGWIILCIQEIIWNEMAFRMSWSGTWPDKFGQLEFACNSYWSS